MQPQSPDSNIGYQSSNPAHTNAIHLDVRDLLQQGLGFHQQ